MSSLGPAIVDDWIVDEIKDALRRAPDLPALNACARHYASKISQLRRSQDREHRTQAFQISNLIEYRRKAMYKASRS